MSWSTAHHLSGTGQELLARPEVRAAYLEGGHALMDMRMLEGILYEEQPRVFLLVTVALGGGAAWLAGRASRRPGGRSG